MDPASRSITVFVVHGRNALLRDSMFAFLRTLGIRPLEWTQAVSLTGKGSPYVGEVLDAAFDHAQAVIVLLSPDEITYLRPEYANGLHDGETVPATQARPNVLFEAGMAMGRNPDRTVMVEVGEMRPFSDVGGRHVVRLDNSAEVRQELAQRLRTAGCEVDSSGSDWLSAGNFSDPEPPGAGLPLGKRLPPAMADRRVRVDLRYHDRAKSGRLEIINASTFPLFNVDLSFPDEARGLHVVTDDLPIRRLPSGKSASLPAFQAGGLGSASRSHFDVTVTGRLETGAEFTEEVFLDVGS